MGQVPAFFPWLLLWTPGLAAVSQPLLRLSRARAHRPLGDKGLDVASGPQSLSGTGTVRPQEWQRLACLGLTWVSGPGSPRLEQPAGSQNPAPSGQGPRGQTGHWLAPPCPHLRGSPGIEGESAQPGSDTGPRLPESWCHWPGV